MKNRPLSILGQDKGITLTELLIVVVIIGILAMLAVPSFTRTIEKAKLGEAISNLNLIRTGQKIYFLEYRSFSPNVADLNIEDPNTPSDRFFDYTLPSSGASNFTARARRKSGPMQYNYDISKDGGITSPDNSPLL